MNNIKIERFPIIKTERLILRNFKLEDAKEYFYYHSLPEATEYYDWKPKTYANAEEDVKLIISDYEEMKFIRWAITLKGSDVLIGDCGYILDGLKGEISYMLSKLQWNKGLMTEALNAVILFGFQKLKLERIQALTLPGNAPSLRLLHKLGFTKEGLLRKYGYNAITEQSNDLVMLSILKTDRRTT